MILLILLLILSLTANGILIWYCRKLVKNLWSGVNNIEDLQSLLSQYCSSLESMYQMEQFYGDDTIKTAIDNTKTIIEACRTYKNLIIQTQEQDSDKTDN